MFFLNPLQPARELLAIFCHFLGPIRVVRRARLERPANRILPDAKTRAPGLKFLGFAVERCRIFLFDIGCWAFSALNSSIFQPPPGT
jgi:hypothetical protein